MGQHWQPHHNDGGPSGLHTGSAKQKKMTAKSNQQQAGFSRPDLGGQKTKGDGKWKGAGAKVWDRLMKRFMDGWVAQ